MAEMSSTAPRPAHRPSRRDDIVAAALRVFSEKGYEDAGLNDIAEAAEVVISAIYYHFKGGKEEIFDCVIESVYADLDREVEAARLSHDTGSAASLSSVVAAAHVWMDRNPRAARLLYSRLAGATKRSEELRAAHEARHVAAAHAYFDATTGGSDVSDSAVELAARTLVHLMISIMPLRLEGGPLSKRSVSGLVASAQAVGNAIISP